MSDIVTIIVLTVAAGLCIPLGGLFASFEHIRPQWLEREFRHFIIALGGGVLLGAVAVVLVPEGVANMHHSKLAIAAVLAGGVSFFLLERQLGLKRRESPQLMSMLLDYIPEAIALGGLVVINTSMAMLLALLIGLQNLPEGFNAYRELIALNGNRPVKTLLSMTALVILGPIAGLFSYYFLADHSALLGFIMLFAAGGILYLIFQDIAPQARLNHHWAPPLGAVVGFCIALFSELVMAV